MKRENLTEESEINRFAPVAFHWNAPTVRDSRARRTTYDETVSRKGIAALVFGPLLVRRFLVHRLDAIESKERRNEYYIAVRELLTDDVVAATLLALRVARFFSATPALLLGVVTPGMAVWTGDITKDKIVHEGLRPRPTTQVSAGKHRPCTRNAMEKYYT